MNYYLFHVPKVDQEREREKGDGQPAAKPKTEERNRVAG